MESIETLFSQLDTELNTLITDGKYLLELSDKIHKDKITIDDANNLLMNNGFDSKKIEDRFIIPELLTELQKRVREKLLMCEHENFTYSFLFYLLKFHHDLKHYFQKAAAAQNRFSILFEEVQRNHKRYQYEFSLSFPFKNRVQLLLIGTVIIYLIRNTSTEFKRILQREFSIKYEDINKLFQYDKSTWQPLPIPRLKLLLMEPSIMEKPQEQTNPLPFQEVTNKKIKWKGSLKQFAELINELEIKAWIEPIAHGELSPSIKALTDCFDFSLTQKKEGSNSTSSLMQYLKASEREDKIYSKRYIKQFDCILPNPTKK